VFDYFLEQSGKHFDPCLVDILLANRDEFIAIGNSIKMSLGVLRMGVDRRAGRLGPPRQGKGIRC
jgi:hypothetical protein